MSGKLQISIPTPCHENWQDMTVANKGRFCASCQKHVIDFTTASDRQIAEVFKKESNVCGRFLPSQLQRDLIIPKERNSLWMAASAAMVAFLGLGNGKIFAQTEKAETVQVEKNIASNTVPGRATRLVSGTVVDETGFPISGTNVKNLTTKKSIQTDFDGNFAIEAETNSMIEFSFLGLKQCIIKVTNVNLNTVKMITDPSIDIDAIGGATLSRER